MHTKYSYKKLFKLINDLYAPKVYGKFHFPLATEHPATPWYETNFAHLLIPINKKKRKIPSIQIGLKDFSKSYSELVAMLAHELGHYFSSISATKTQRPSEALYSRFYKQKPLTTSEKKLILDEENRAWKLGLEFLQDNDFEIYHEMLTFKKLCLKGYYRYCNRILVD